MPAPLVGAAMLQGGAGILGGLASYFGGSGQRKRQKQLYNQGQGMLGQDAFDPSEIGQFAFRGMQPQFNALSGRLNQQFGLDSGTAQGEMANSLLSTQYGLFADLQKQNQLAKYQGDRNLLGTLSNINRG